MKSGNTDGLFEMHREIEFSKTSFSHRCSSPLKFKHRLLLIDIYPELIKKSENVEYNGYCPIVSLHCMLMDMFLFQKQ